MTEITKKIDQVVSSRTTWTLIALLVVNVIPEIKYLFDPEQQVYLNVILTMAAVYFKVYPSQEYK